MISKSTWTSTWTCAQLPHLAGPAKQHQLHGLVLCRSFTCILHHQFGLAPCNPHCRSAQTKRASPALTSLCASQETWRPSLTGTADSLGARPGCNTHTKTAPHFASFSPQMHTCMVAKKTIGAPCLPRLHSCSNRGGTRRSPSLGAGPSHQVHRHGAPKGTTTACKKWGIVLSSSVTAATVNPSSASRGAAPRLRQDLARS